MLVLKDCKSVWYGCLQIIKESIGEQSYKTWFEPIVPLNLKGNVLTIQVPSQFFYEWLEENYVHLLKKAIDMELGPEGRLEYSITVNKTMDANKPFSMNSSATTKAASAVSNGKNQPGNVKESNYTSPFELKNLDKHSISSQLNSNYTFETLKILLQKSMLISEI